jgi:hypothetical protein
MTHSPDRLQEIPQSAALLLVLLEPPAPLEEEFNDWYDFEHFPQRMGVPGFVSGERWVAIAGWPRYLARYKLRDFGVFDSPDYLAISGSNNSPWSKRVLPRTLGRQRLALEVLSQKATHLNATCLCLIMWTLDDAGHFEGFLQQALTRVESLTGVTEAQWCRSEKQVVGVLGFDHIITQQDLTLLSRVEGAGTRMINIYIRYQR